MADNSADHIEFLKRGGCLADLIETLGPALTSEDDTPRSAAVRDLVKVLSDYPACLRTSAEINTVATFLTDKLTDRACVTSALEGCLKLIQLHEACHESGQEPQLDLDVGIVKRMEQTMLQELPIASLSHDNRRGCLTLLLAITKVFGEGLLGQGVRLVEDVTQVVDGERDPRCLLVAFDLIRAVVTLYSTHNPRSLENAAEELCDVVACYFPITFRLPPNAAHGITRDILAAALEPVLSSTPSFAPFVIPLLLDKLASALWQAKMDAMSALAACVEAWGPAAVAVQLPRIWWALREELTEPSYPDGAEGGKGTAAAAAECLRRCLAARDSGHKQDGPPQQTLLKQVLEDEHVVDLPQWLAESSTAGESATTARRFAVANEILTAASGASRAAFRALMQRLHRSLLGHIDSGGDVAAGLALSSAVALFKGAAQGAAGQWAGDKSADFSPGEFQSELKTWGGSLATAALQQVSTAGSGIAKTALLRVRLLAQLASFPPEAAQPLTPEQMRSAVEALAAVVTDESSAAELAHEAAVGVAAIAGAGHINLVESNVLPTLLTAVTGPQSDEIAPQPPPLACMVAISRSAPSLRATFLKRLCNMAMDTLAALRSGSALQSMADSLLSALVEDVLPACTQPFQGVEATAAASIAKGLISAAPQLPQGDESSGIVLRAAAAAQVAAAGCSGEDQADIAIEAAKAVLETAAAAENGEPSAAVVQNGVAVAAAVVIALQPGVGVVPESGSPLESLRALLSAALRAQSNWAAEVVMAAVASTILKWPAGRFAAAAAAAAAAAVEVLSNAGTGAATISVDDAVATALDETVLPQIQLQLAQEATQRRLRAVRLLGWVGKGLAMRGHDRAALPLEVAAAYLESASLDLAGTEEEMPMEGSEPEESEVFDAAEARAMAEVFATVVGPGEGCACLNERVHARGRILWQQKAFEQAAVALGGKLEEGETFLGAPPPPLLLGLAHLTGACPPRIVAGSLPRLLRWLLAALEALATGPLQDAGALKAALSTVEHALDVDSGKELLQAQLHTLVAALLADARFEADADVRSRALACLEKTTRLPYDRLHPHRRAVLGVLSAAVDDPKRAVRLQAARTRRAWMPA